MKKVLVGVFLCLATVSALRAAEDGELPIRRVILYKNGVGYFERQGQVARNQIVRLTFKADQMSDVLKSLTIIDRRGGKVSAVNYDASESSERLLAQFPFKLASGADIGVLLDQLKGAQVRLTAGANTIEGAVVGTCKIQLDEHREATQASLLLSNGELKNVLLSDVGSVKLLDPNLQQDLRRYLEILSSGRRRDLRTLTLTSAAWASSSADPSPDPPFVGPADGLRASFSGVASFSSKSKCRAWLPEKLTCSRTTLRKPKRLTSTR